MITLGLDVGSLFTKAVLMNDKEMDGKHDHGNKR